MNPIQPIKTYNRMHPNPTKDEILEWARQDDNYTWAKGYLLIKEVKGRETLIPLNET